MSDYLSISDSLRSRYRRGISWNVLGAVFSQGSTFLANVLIANLLGREVFGEFGMVQSTVLTLSSIAQVATGITATKYVAEFRSTDKERAGRILGFCWLMTLATGVLATVSLVAGAPWLAKHMLNAPHLAAGIAISAGFVLFSVMNGYQVGALSGLESYRAIAISGAATGLAHLLICVLGSWMFGLEGALAAVAISAMGRWALFGWVIRREAACQGIKSSRQGLSSERRIFLSFALPAALGGLSTLPALWLANTFLVQQPGGYSEMGLYSAANNLRTLILFLPLLLNNVGTSLLNNQRGIGNEYQYRRLFWANTKATAGSVVVASFAVALAGAWLMRLFGKDFMDGYLVLLVLTISTIPEGLALALYQIVQSRAKMWLSLLAIAIPRDVLLVVCSYELTSMYGATGLALAYAIAWTTTLGIVVALVYRIGFSVGDK